MDLYAGLAPRWDSAPGEAFTGRPHGAETSYPPCRARTDDVRPAADPRYTHPESFRASVTNATTTAPFITFSGVPDELVLDPNGQPCTFTFRDDAGRELGSLDLASGPSAPLPTRARRVDVTNNGSAAAVVTVTGYYRPMQRPALDRQTDVSAAPVEGAPATAPH